MIKVPRRKSGVSNVIFVVSIGVLLVICVAFSFMAFYQSPNSQSSNNQLQLDYNQLQTDFDLLQSDYNGLEANYENLQMDYNTLQWENEQIESDLSNLQSSFDQLSAAHQQLLASVPSGQGITIDSIYYKPHYLIPSGVYNVTVRNHCSSDVHVTALKLYHDTTLISSKAVSVSIPANSAVTIEEFLAFSLTENLHVLKIETLEGYTVTSDPLSN